MSSELRQLIFLALELILLGAIITIVILGATIGRANLNTFVATHDYRLSLPQVVAYSKGSVGYYELVDLIDSYAPTADVTIIFPNNEASMTFVTFTSAPNGKLIRLAVGSEAPKVGETFTGDYYTRMDGQLYKNGTPLVDGVTTLTDDMKLPFNSLWRLRDLRGNGVLHYEFIENLFEWLREERFICTVTQVKDSTHIEKIELRMQK